MVWDGGFEIGCVDLREESEFNDQRAIERIGILAPILKEKKLDVAWSMQRKKQEGDAEHHYVHLKVDGVVRYPVAKKHNNHKYLSMTGELSENDPLLDLPSIAEYKQQERLDNLM